MKALYETPDGTAESTVVRFSDEGLDWIVVENKEGETLRIPRERVYYVTESMEVNAEVAFI